MRLVVFFLLLCVAARVQAQTTEGVALDKETLNPVYRANIINLRTGYITVTDTAGHFIIPTEGGDTLLFRHASYMTTEEVIAFSLGTRYKTVLLLPLVHKLSEATVVGLTKYQQDSVARHEFFHHEMTRQIVPPAPKFAGLGCAGCFGWLADKITGNSRKPRRFRKQFATEDEQKFIDSRYTLKLVMQLTALTDTETVAGFMNTYPMEYAYARTASDLEMKAWIRSNFKEYRAAGHLSGHDKSPAQLPDDKWVPNAK
jgi:hypothetical protein